MTRIGTRKLHYLIKPYLDKMGIKCGDDRLFAILKIEGMLVKKKRNYMRNTNSYHRFKKYPNLIKDIEINRAEQVWVCDITYIKTSKGFSYLTLITDAYSKQGVGYQLTDNLRPHESCNKLTPIQAHASENFKLKKWPMRFRKNQTENNLTLDQLCHT
jgi:transposase InsO family protein